MSDKPSPAPARSRGSFFALVGAACAAIATPLVVKWESGGREHLTAYRDIVGVWTICDGDTQNVRPGMVETRAGCEARRDRQLAAHAAPVLRCTPSLRGHSNQLAAAISLTYNIGPSAYCGSTAARRFNAGDWEAACDAFRSWRMAGGRVVQGLVNRRADERRLCLTAMPPRADRKARS